MMVYKWVLRPSQALKDLKDLNAFLNCLDTIVEFVGSGIVMPEKVELLNGIARKFGCSVFFQPWTVRRFSEP